MENKKSSKGKRIIITVISIIVVLLVTLCLLVKFNVIDNPFAKKSTSNGSKGNTTVTDKTSANSNTKDSKDETTESTETTSTETTTNPKDSDEPYELGPTKANLSESDLVKDTTVTLSCDKNVVASVVDGNIEIKDGNKTATIKVGDAKYLKLETVMSCDKTFLLYITNQGQIYSIKNVQDLASKNEKIIDITEAGSKKLTNTQDYAEAFLKDGIVSKTMKDKYGYTSYNAGFKDADGEIGTVTYNYILLP